MTSLGAKDKISKKIIFPKNASNEHKRYQCILCGKYVNRHGTKKTYYFKHEQYSNCNFFTNTEEKESWEHIFAKHILKDILDNPKINLKIERECDKCKERVNVEVEDFSNMEVKLEYKFKYKECDRKADIACLKNGEIKYIFEICKSNPTNEENRYDPWVDIKSEEILKYQDIILNDKYEKEYNLTCIRKKCEKCYKPNEENTENGIIYFNQRGAGCGKTYESIQLVQNDERFKEKEIFIYLTKMHSAKDVINAELQEQISSKKLELEEDINKKNITKQYGFSYYDVINKKEITILIGTIDSFNFHIANKANLTQDNDYFKGILKTIMVGDMKITDLQYGGYKINLNKKCLIIIDEAQDLGPLYIRAFDEVILKSKIDLYIIGDKLQSIWDEKNIYTHILNTPNIKSQIKQSTSINKVMRFHNNKFIDFVNHIIPYEDYNLQKINDICDRTNCSYIHNDSIPYSVFPFIDIYSVDKNDEHIEFIIKKMDDEVLEHKYLPNNFMIIFPMLSKNAFAYKLETRIQQFWVDKFNDKNYINNIKNRNGINNSYLKDEKDYYQYVYLHKSEESKPINLLESENATRILSIHASKGTGCEVVFVLGITESKLNMFNKNKDKLVYDSLLHVAITRQKKKLYIGINCNGDDINKRFSKYIDYENGIISDLKMITTNISISEIRKTFWNSINIDNLKNTYLENQYDNIIQKIKNTPTNLIDYGHHNIRYSVIFLKLITLLSEEGIKDQVKEEGIKNQVKAVLTNFYYNTANIEYKNYNEYNKYLYEIIDSNKTLESMKLLRFRDKEESKYHEYCSILNEIIQKIREKVNKYIWNNSNLELCSLEYIILYFCINILSNGYRAEITIYNIYNIINVYAKTYVNLKDEEKCDRDKKCICDELFKDIKSSSTNNKIYNSIRNHYEMINRIDSLYKHYLLEKINNEINDEKFSYNINHSLCIGDYKKKDNEYKSQNFNIRDEYPIIGYSKNAVIIINISPTLSELNINEKISNSIIDNFIAIKFNHNFKEDKNDNYKKFNNKNIYTCIFTLDCNIPIIYKINIDDYNFIYDKIELTIKEKFTEYHKILYLFASTKKGMEGIKLLSEKITKKSPIYIERLIDELDESLDDILDNNENIDKDIFIKKFDKKLIEKLLNFKKLLNI